MADAATREIPAVPGATLPPMLTSDQYRRYGMDGAPGPNNSNPVATKTRMPQHMERVGAFTRTPAIIAQNGAYKE